MTPESQQQAAIAFTALTGYGFYCLHRRASLVMVFMTSCSAAMAVRLLSSPGVSQ